MQKNLTEAADFLTIDLQAVLNIQKPEKQQSATADDEIAATSESANDADENEEQVQTRPADFNWGEELESRLNKNRNMSKESRQSEYDIETKFFKEFFNTYWDKECATQLMLMGDPLRRSLKDYDFNDKTNPIFAFLSLDYVKNNLIKTKLLNINTFKAIKKAVDDALVADSEFFVANNYNIIYCRDLYSKSLNELLEYLAYQKSTLKPNATVYTVDDQKKNVTVFINLKSLNTGDIKNVDDQQTVGHAKVKLSVKDPKVKLNSLDVVKARLSKTKTLSKKTKVANSDALQKIADNFTSLDKVCAALQYISMQTGSEKAIKALSSVKFDSVSAKDLISASRTVSSIISKVNFSKSDLEAFIDLLLANI